MLTWFFAVENGGGEWGESSLIAENLHKKFFFIFNAQQVIAYKYVLF